MSRKQLAHAFGRQVAAVRKAQHLSQKTLDGLLAQSRGYTESIERGQHTVTLYTLFRLAGVLGVAPAILLPEVDLSTLLTPAASKRLLTLQVRAVADTASTCRDAAHLARRTQKTVMATHRAQLRQLQATLDQCLPVSAPPLPMFPAPTCT